MHPPSPLISLFQYKAWANQELLHALRSLDPLQQHDELHAALRILNHIYVVDRIFAAHLQGEAHPYQATNTPQTPSLEALHQAVTTSDHWYLAYVAELSEDQRTERLSFQFVDGDAGCMSREEILLHLITHGSYHRGAVGRIMAQLSLAPPRDIYSRFVHQAEPQRRQPLTTSST